MQIQIIRQIPAPGTVDVLIPISKDDALPKKLAQVAANYGLSSEALASEFKAEAKECLLTYFPNSARKVFLLGLGSKPAAGDMIHVFRQFSYSQKGKLNSSLTIDLISTATGGDTANTLAEMAIEGLLMGTYQVGLYKTGEKSAHPLANAPTLQIALGDAENIPETVLQRGQIVADTKMRILDLVNAPGNKKTPRTLSEWALASGKEYGYQVTIFDDREEMARMGLHALLAVNQGSPLPPALIVMEYQPASEAALPKVGLVGKGVTFDTGGISLKDSNNMHFMKSDMGGAAAVLGTMESAARLGLPVHLIGIIASTENCIDGESVKPGDVIGSYLGKTIEVIDTDAEGRLILADALAYMAKNYQPASIIDLATLTGSCVRTFGYHCGGLMSNNDALANALLQSGEISGERLWRLPIWDLYNEDIQSDVADVRNFSGKPMAGAISAAKFLEVFIDKHPSWAHLDIAGMAFGNMEYASQKAATGYGIRLLLHYLMQQSAF